MNYIPTVVIKEAVRWEYHVVDSAEPLTTHQLTEFGDEGWELSAILPQPNLLLYYFKRII